MNVPKIFQILDNTQSIQNTKGFMSWCIAGLKREARITIYLKYMSKVGKDYAKKTSALLHDPK